MHKSAFYFEHELIVARKNSREKKKPNIHLIKLVVVSDQEWGQTGSLYLGLCYVARIGTYYYF